ncbi:hypothetical protein [Sphingomicrobium flavum]|uniref:hypothetical protein n=1 Tax=Sphingomicrobium flavum TaxID=1229164 RepID=UPI0021AD5779|nr:hypothetical protein [Sphingomicrobium flavum]
MRWVAPALIIAMIGAPVSAAAQSTEPVITYGDAGWRAQIDPMTRTLRDQIAEAPRSTRQFLFTEANILDMEGALWAEIDAQLPMAGTGRIVVEAPLPGSKIGAEYYFDGGELLFVYEAHYFTDQAAPTPISRNFKGFAAWERLTYFHDGKIVFAVSGGNGADAPGHHQERLKRQGAALLGLFPTTGEMSSEDE